MKDGEVEADKGEISHWRLHSGEVVVLVSINAVIMLHNK